MSTIQILILAVAVSMDAFAVSICRGVQSKGKGLASSIEAGLYFGGFQALMPTIGYIIGEQFDHLIYMVDHWVAFALLSMLGARMLCQAIGKEKSESGTGAMLILAFATSIDALAVGLSLALVKADIILAAAIIGTTTFCFSAVGVQIGARLGDKYKSKAEIVGGALLIFIGLGVLIEHLMA